MQPWSGSLACNAMTLSGVIRRVSGGERQERDRRVTSDRVIAFILWILKDIDDSASGFRIAVIRLEP
jgi:hypothetical protein